VLEPDLGEVWVDGLNVPELSRREPQLLNTFQSALNNANDISVTANQSFQRLSKRVDSLTNTLQLAIERGSANINDITGQLDLAVRRNTGHVDVLPLTVELSLVDRLQTYLTPPTIGVRQ